MTEKFIAIAGACHCRNVRFVLRWPRSAGEVGVRKCGCTFCHKHAAAWTSNNNAQLDVRCDDTTRLSRYRFGTKSADFYVCGVCGVAPFVISEIDGNAYAVVNVNAFDDTHGLVLTGSHADFDGEDVGSRLERRKRNWIARVSFVD